MPAAKHRYVALLRALNVGGNAVITMADLGAQFEAAGMNQVSTHGASGNVLFTAKLGDPDRVARALEKQLGTSLGYPITVFVRTVEQLRDAVAHNPLDPAKHAKDQQCHLMFLSGAPDAAHQQALHAKAGDYRIGFHRDVVYFAYARALAGTRKPLDIEKILGLRGTARTYKVIDDLIVKLAK